MTTPTSSDQHIEEDFEGSSEPEELGSTILKSVVSFIIVIAFCLAAVVYLWAKFAKQ